MLANAEPVPGGCAACEKRVSAEDGGAVSQSFIYLFIY